MVLLISLLMLGNKISTFGGYAVLFMSFIVLCIYSGVDIYDTVSLYKNDIILSIRCKGTIYFSNRRSKIKEKYNFL